jgi:hypothetical protein
MLRSLKDLERYKVSAIDGELGVVQNFLFDDFQWAIRYLVVETGSLFDRRHDVLISPFSFRDVDDEGHRFSLSLTKQKIEASPDVDTDKPVSRQHEMDYYGYFGYPYYWGTAGVWGMSTYPLMPPAVGTAEPKPEPLGDAHLRSCQEVRGYHVQAPDGEIGHIADLIVDDANWSIQYLVVDTSNWWVGRKVLVAPRWASSISWDQEKVFVGLSRDAIQQSPEWDAQEAMQRDYEERLHAHYGRRPYWLDQPSASQVAPSVDRHAP